MMSGRASVLNWLPDVQQLDTSAKCSAQRWSLSVSLERMVLHRVVITDTRTLEIQGDK